MGEVMSTVPKKFSAKTQTKVSTTSVIEKYFYCLPSRKPSGCCSLAIRDKCRSYLHIVYKGRLLQEMFD